MDNPNSEGSSFVLPRFAEKGMSTISRAWSKKTVDAVWGDVQHRQERNASDKSARGQRLSLGEITLEDFLVKASVAESANKRSQGHDGMHNSTTVRDITHNYQQQGQWLDLELQVPSSIRDQQVQPRDRNLIDAFMPKHPINAALSITNGPSVDMFTDNNPMGVSSSPEAFLEMDIRMRKRLVRDNCVEETTDRKQKRMMKNRESAARSRARKQAYTSELENKISHLEEENERLRKQKMLQTILLGTPPQQDQKCLHRRVRSASF